MPLNLYRRHRKECEGGHPFESRSGEFEERKKGWKCCACFIFASGTLGGSFKRKYTGKVDWHEARAVAAEWETAASWGDTPVPQPLAAPVEKPAPARIAIADAIKVFLGNREGAKIAPATLRKYKTFTKQLTAFAEIRGYLMLDQLTAADIDIFYSGGSWAHGRKQNVSVRCVRFSASA